MHKNILRYIFMPQILPRIQGMFMGLAVFNYMIAVLLHAGGLIPRSSPVLNPRRVSKLRLRDVVFQAANHVKWRWADADRIAFLAAVILSLFLIIVQLIMIAVSGAVSQAHATSFFSTEPAHVNTDVVLIFLEQVFGPDIGVFETNSEAIGTPIHSALYAMLSFYSQAMMVLAVFIVVYYIITVVGEAAISGTPFGRRFNSMWAPIRLIVALGLLVPLGSGLNSAQYITLYTAKMGSGLASQGWMRFAEIANQPGQVFAKAMPPKIEALVKGVFLSEVCRHASNRVQSEGGSDVVQNVTVVGANVTNGFTNGTTTLQNAGLLPPGHDPNSFWVAVPLAEDARFRWTTEPGDTEPKATCGEVVISLQTASFRVNGTDAVPLQAITTIQSGYINEITNIQGNVTEAAQKAVDLFLNFRNPTPANARPDTRGEIVESLRNAVNEAQRNINTAVSEATIQIQGTQGTELYSDMIQRGWGGAGLFYVRIGEINQKYSEAARQAPESSASDGRPDAWDALWSWVGTWFGGQGVDYDLRNLLSSSEDLFTSRVRTQPELLPTGGFIDSVLSFDVGDVVKRIFGLRALYDFHASGAANLNPMVGLMQIGNDMIERSKEFAIAYAAIRSAQTIADTIGSRMPVVQIFSGFLALISPILGIFILIGLGIGILLYYLLPLMPFIYFFFAVVAWVMEIFEALVGVPLWALAHLKIDGDGLPGPLATNGYFLLLGILIRPILIVFGMIGGYTIFAGGAYFLQSTFTVVVNNVRGETVGIFGTFVYTVIFAFLAYHLGLMCFKMVDTVPNSILRWIGQGGATPFSDNRSDPLPNAQGLMFAGAATMGQFSKALESSGAGAAKMAGGVSSGFAMLRGKGGGTRGASQSDPG